jgi:hypothetical protein
MTLRARLLSCVVLPVALGCVVGLLLSGCAPKQDKTPIDNGQVIPSIMVRIQFPGELDSFAGDEWYSVVNSAWLKGYYERFRDDLFAKDVVGWQERFDCNKFAAAYASGAQLEFYRDKWGTWAPGTALAIGEFWYTPAGGTTGHAIVTALTERGRIFIEPQSGREVTLTKAEIDSAYLVKF